MEVKKSYEIDIVKLALTILKDWKKVILYSFIGGLFGTVIAFNTPKTYTADVLLAPELASGGLSGNLSDIASSFGFDLDKNSSADAIYPELYPAIFSSSDFIEKLFDAKVRLIDDNEERTYIDHLRHDLDMPFWSYPMWWIKEALKKPEPAVKGTPMADDPFRITKNKALICSNIQNAITCVIDKKTSEITISFTDQDPMVAAIMADTLKNRLQAYITDYRTSKARIDFQHYDQLAEEALADYQKIESDYAHYCDSHLGATLASVSAQQSKLENDMSVSYALYTSMVKMREQAKAKIQERTPAFTLIQSAKTPIKPSSRPRILTGLLFALLGGMIASGHILYKNRTF